MLGIDNQALGLALTLIALGLSALMFAGWSLLELIERKKGLSK
jgi:hypothetical protein